MRLEYCLQQAVKSGDKGKIIILQKSESSLSTIPSIYSQQLIDHTNEHIFGKPTDTSDVEVFPVSRPVMKKGIDASPLVKNNSCYEKQRSIICPDTSPFASVV